MTTRHPEYITTAGKFKLDWFPPELIALQKEVLNHTELCFILANQPDKDVYISLMEIAKYCDFAVAGTFTRDDIIELCSMCLKRLKAKRTILIFSEVPPSPNTQ